MKSVLPFLASCAIGLSLSLAVAGVATAQTNSGQNSQSGSQAGVVSESRSITAAVNMVEIRGNVDLRMRQGATPQLVVRAQPKWMPKITTSQGGARLVIETEKESWTVGREATPVVELTIPNLRELSISGSGDADVSGFKGDQLHLSLAGSGSAKFAGQYSMVKTSMAGSGNLKMDAGAGEKLNFNLAGSGDATVSGSGKSLELSIAGSGAFNGKDLKVDSVRVSSAGSGNAAVFATSAIAVSAVGSGDVSIYGKPSQRSVSKVGSGGVNYQ
jgi:hypothetical protein